MDIKTVAVAGTGMMGPGIAAISALAGRDTIVVSRRMDSAAAGVESAKNSIGWLKENGLAKADTADAALGRFQATDDPAKH